ncbi:IS66 family insertion sequence element accessory protein TnpA [Leptospira licerasiae]|uniref:IS66 family insertion sequence element accessory protein TnpA n=1 Tax=Leptospira licerasiae TaxID=447106 RepID=UPI0010840031|nr:hypothetical protein [Leptospira licerasiae]TGM90993.1 hypothetical protein EHR05_09495 [Leptospira licerasiae]
MKKTNIDWEKEFEDFSKSGISQPQYCREKQIKYSTFRYHWERRTKAENKKNFVEIPFSSVKAADTSSESEFLTLKIDSSGKARLQVNLQFSLGIWS